MKIDLRVKPPHTVTRRWNRPLSFASRRFSARIVVRMTRIVSELRDVPSLPTPNVISLVLSEETPPAGLVASSFGLVFSDAGFLMTNLRARGWDIPGGHVEAGESPRETALREVREETGVEAEVVGPVGYQRVRIDGPVPSDYRYPTPESFQLFFLAVPLQAYELSPTDEVIEARFWPLPAARELQWVRDHADLFEEAVSRWQTRQG